MCPVAYARNFFRWLAGRELRRALPCSWVIGYRASKGTASQPPKNPRKHIAGTRLAPLGSGVGSRRSLSVGSFVVALASGPVADRIQCSTIATEGAHASGAKPRVLDAYLYVSSGNRILASEEYRSYSFNRLTGTSTICLTSGERGLMLPVLSPSRNALNPCLGRHR